MMSNLFSIFDPSTSFWFFQINWISSLISIFFLPYFFWFYPSRLNFFWINFNLLMLKEMKTILNEKINSNNLILLLSLFLFILFNNFMGLFPYIFTSTSHMILPLTLAFPLWLMLFIYSWLFKTNFTFSHLVPQSTPTILMPFMVLIETISNIIRPWTLSIRLTANMIAGHILMSLMSMNMSSLNYWLIYCLILIQTILILLEFAVSIIQAYVFTILSSLYSSEVPKNN
uniref:ATP synthase subunit a n=1 Tax=Xiphydria sp. ZJUH 2008002 TaxID=2488325 RepID=A0A3G5BC72_9HYME|nr:ATP synthase F0 subunit 6 [Euxiphydria potanini]AYV97247.1 ATP synthase F0 subunit 6 [Xiphydria sp. ZJUH 2008002]UYW35399.1 ATP synthase subunit 6 [Euxiphydria potanini]